MLNQVMFRKYITLNKNTARWYVERIPTSKICKVSITVYFAYEGQINQSLTVTRKIGQDRMKYTSEIKWRLDNVIYRDLLPLEVNKTLDITDDSRTCSLCCRYLTDISII
jgi:uncharacterized membrane protein